MEDNITVDDLTAWFTFDFTDEQWGKLIRWSGELSRSARTDFTECCKGYLVARHFHREHEIKRRGDRERLLRKIRRLTKDSQWRGAICSLEGLDMGVPGRFPPPPIGQLLDNLLTLLATKLENANLQVGQESSRPGPKLSQPAHQFIANAAALLERHMGTRATRSEKGDKSNFQKFIDDLCAIVDPSIGPGTVDGALKIYIKKGVKRPVVRIALHLSEPLQ